MPKFEDLRVDSLTAFVLHRAGLQKPLEFTQKELELVAPFVKEADSQTCSEFAEQLFQSELFYPISITKQTDVLNKVVYSLYFRDGGEYKEGTRFDEMVRKAEEQLPESSELRLAYEELDFWIWK